MTKWVLRIVVLLGVLLPMAMAAGGCVQVGGRGNEPLVDVSIGS